MICEVNGFPLEQRTLKAVAKKLGCTVRELKILHGQGQVKRVSELVRANPGLMAIQDNAQPRDWWTAVYVA